MVQNDKYQVPMDQLVRLLELHKQELSARGERPTSQTLAHFLQGRCDVLLKGRVLHLSVGPDELQEVLENANYSVDLDDDYKMEQALNTMRLGDAINFLDLEAIRSEIRSDVEYEESYDDDEPEEESEEEEDT